MCSDPATDAPAGSAPPPAPGPVVRVALDVPLDTLFDYLAPQAEATDLGRCVTVPFGRHRRVGVILAIQARSELAPDRLKPVHAIHRDDPPLPPDLLELAHFAAGYYRHPLGAVLAGLLPPDLRRPGRHTRCAPPAAYRLTPAGQAALAALPARAHAQRALAQRLAAGPLGRSAASPAQRALLRTWQRQGWLAEAPEHTDTPPAAAPVTLPQLTPEQAAVVQALAGASGFTPVLLHGVTGSGKTEVYLRLAAEVLAQGRQVLILVPEIHLTPQFTQRIAQRFPGQRLLSLHSGLAAGERRHAWLAALEGAAEIVLGTRLAVFTPMPRLGLVVVDEEHDPAFKQFDGMRYSARDLAVWRARQREVPVILGSATPALESWRNARAGRYRLYALTQRAHAQAVLPQVTLIDSRADRPRQGLGATLVNALRACLERGEQALVFINRRGYAPSLLCHACGHAFACPRCSAHLVLHRTGGTGFRLLCHHCGLIAPPAQTCPNCGSLDLRPAGQGTQRVEEALAQHFPHARLLRIDRDSAARKGAFAAMKRQVEARAVDILVGTQIVAKGHDFPHLTLVGVIGADQALVSPDFRAGERLFAQLMQVAGRAGRAERRGEVLIQTAYPQHPLYRAVVAHDYPGYAAQALRERRAAGFPPYVSQAVLRAEGRDEHAVLAWLLAAHAAGEALAAAHAVQLFDPVPALMRRVAHQHRMQLLLQCPSRAALQGFLDAWVPGLHAQPGSGLRWVLDVDPLDV